MVRAKEPTMKVLLSAFACEPYRGSEPEVGFRALLAAAEQHDVCVLTSSTCAAPLQRFLRTDGRGSRVRVESLPPGIDEGASSIPKFHWHYDQWQRRAARRALELHRELDFDLVHHVTMATVWTRVGVAAVPRPLIWGPVGGGVEPPWRLFPVLGVRGVAGDLTRVAGRRILARLPPMRAAPRQAAVVIAQNAAVAARVGSRARPIVLPNALFVEMDMPPSRRDGATAARSADIVMASRLVPWKGGSLAVRAMRHLRHPTATLRIFGVGPDRARMESLSRRWGLADRVEFAPYVPRRELLDRLAVAGVLLHPSLHDDSALSVAEALAVGTPVVCLDHGGPAEVARSWPSTPSRLVTPTAPETTARGLAAAVDDLLAARIPVATDARLPGVSFREQLLAMYETAVSVGTRP
jgi:glycosyltransferase involved in cell wall biosynthesis